MLRPVFILCPDCRCVYETTQEEADAPTATTRVGVNPCAKCRAKQRRRAEQAAAAARVH